jgi:hypothetical protein
MVMVDLLLERSYRIKVMLARRMRLVMDAGGAKVAV